MSFPRLQTKTYQSVRAFFIKHQDRVLFGTDLMIGWDVFDDRAWEDMAEFRQFYDANWRFFETDE